MPNKKTSVFRVFGDELGREVSFIDVTVSGTDLEGQIYFEEKVDGNETPEKWVFDAESLGELHEDDCDGDLVPSDDCSVCNVCFYSPCS